MVYCEREIERISQLHAGREANISERSLRVDHVSYAFCFKVVIQLLQECSSVGVRTDLYQLYAELMWSALSASKRVSGEVEVGHACLRRFHGI